MKGLNADAGLGGSLLGGLSAALSLAARIRPSGLKVPQRNLRATGRLVHRRRTGGRCAGSFRSRRRARKHLAWRSARGEPVLSVWGSGPIAIAYTSGMLVD